MLQGSLYNVKILPNSSTAQYKAEINRLSGPLNLHVLNRFTSPVSILNGNLFSCSNLPQNDEDRKEYRCGSQELEISFYYWCGFFSFTVLILVFCAQTKHEKIRSIYVKWTLETSSNNLLCDDAMKSILPRASHLLSSLNKLNKATIVIIAIIITLGIVIYSSLKCSAASEFYKTHLEQYQYLISGVYPMFTKRLLYFTKYFLNINQC